jgi:hypothetical protein
MKHDIIIIDTDGKIKLKPEEFWGYGTVFGSVIGGQGAIIQNDDYNMIVISTSDEGDK